MSKDGTFLGLMTGLAAGVVLGLLFAPEKGTKTREKLRKMAAEGYEDFKDFIDDEEPAPYEADPVYDAEEKAEDE
ncbi:MAG: YtxH domain-containing protein [Bacteroidales bacterium]|nr:YtxH domain-containing protein [Bacteroidales bacterium]